MSVLSRVSLEESLVVPKTPTAWVVDLPLPGARSLSRSDRMGSTYTLLLQLRRQFDLAAADLQLALPSFVAGLGDDHNMFAGS